MTGAQSRKVHTEPRYGLLMDQAHALGIPMFMKEDPASVIGDERYQELPEEFEMSAGGAENMAEVIDGILINEVEAKNIMILSSLPVGGQFRSILHVGCTYLACLMLCLLCEALYRTIKEEWGNFLDGSISRKSRIRRNMLDSGTLPVL